MSGGQGVLIAGGYRQYVRRTSENDLRDYVSSLASKSLQMDSSGNVDVSGVINVGTAGGIFQGTGTFAIPTTGLKIYSDGTNGLIELWDASAKAFSLTHTKLLFGSDVSAAATTALAVFAEAATYNSESLGAGDVLLGDNSANKANLLWDKSAGKLQLRGGTTMQCEIGTDGKLYAGAGAVILDSTGIAVSISTDYEDLRAYRFTSSGSTRARLLARQPDSTRHDLVLDTVSVAAHISTIQIVAHSPTTYYSEVDIWASCNTGPHNPAGVEIRDDDDTASNRFVKLTTSDQTATLQSTGFWITGDLGYTTDLRPYRNSTYYTGYVFVPLTTPLTSTAFDGDSFSDTAATAINLQLAVGSGGFGAPAGIKAVAVRIRARDSGSAAETSCYVGVGPTETYFYALLLDLGGVANDAYQGVAGVVPCDSNGDIWYSVAASGASTMDVTIDIWGYWI